ncbi:hypothetical protein D3C85_1403940 [compost metagenome]
MAAAELVLERLTLQELRLGADGTQGRQLGFDMGELVRVVNREKVAVVAKLAVDVVAHDALAHFVAGDLADRGIGFVVGKAPMAKQFIVSRVFMSDDKTGVACRRALRGVLAINHDNPRLRVHFSQGMGGTEPGDARADHQPVGFLRAAQASAYR